MSSFSVNEVSFAYNGVKVFEEVSLKIPGGKVTAFLGANGSGKTTMQKLLLGLLKPDTGSILFDDKPLSEYGIRELSKSMGWVPQVEEPSFPYKVQEYLMLGRAPYLGFLDLPDSRDTEIVEHVLERLKMTGLAEREITRMSGGEKRMVLIARALVQEPSVLLLDEPTSHLDLGNKASILELIAGLRETGDTIIFSTHDPNEAIQVADHIILFHGGEVLVSGLPCDVLSVENLKRVYGANLRLLHIEDRFFIDFGP
ncbi:MAG: ABC transporter ATP-binding protein [Candidatus Bathyarchaeota archaeon]|nr:ABC transporter ATP-binding protein [Candidatus Bathyarchaeota archaeon]